MTARLKIGISACFFHPDASRRAAPSKTLPNIVVSSIVFDNHG